jgi:hypothetical protein
MVRKKVMGLFDVLKKKKPETPEPEARGGKIETYNVADNVGAVRLGSGELLRFGRSACQGFEPAVGVQVLVQSAAPHPLGGERAQVMVRDPSDSNYEQHVAARNAAAVPAPPLPAQPPLPTRPIDPDLLKRLGNIAAANTLVRGGQDPERLVLATNVNGEGKIDADRPTMRFKFDVQRAGADHWDLAAGIDDATAYCRFSLGFDLPELPLMDPATFDMANSPGFQLVVSKPADHERSTLARSAFLLSWRVDGGMEAPSIETPLQLNVTVMGIELTRLPHAYVPTVKPNEHWVLLKCHRGEQSFWLGLDLSTGAGEVFPRRGELESYKLALDFLYTFT